MSDDLSKLINGYLGPGGSLACKLSGYEERSEQLSMSESVLRSIQEGRFLVIEAGTGTGKTLAYLLPAILSGRKVVISTGTKNLQEQLIYKDLPLLLEHFDFKAAVMKGRGNYLCWYRFGQFSEAPLFSYRDDIEHFAEIVEWSKTTQTGDRAEVPGLPDDYRAWREISASAEQCLGSKCADFGRCFITEMRARAQEADVVVVNHHLFFADLSVRMGGYGEVIPRTETVIFDEAHELWEIATDYFGYQVSNWRVEDLIGDVKREQGLGKLGRETLRQVLRTMDELHELSVDFFSTFSKSRGSYGSRSGSAEEGTRFRLKQDQAAGMLDDAERLLEHLDSVRARLKELASECEPLFNLSKRAKGLRGELKFILEQSDTENVYWCEVRGRGVFLHSSPIMPGELLCDQLYSELKAAVFTSATLAVPRSGGWSFEYFKRGLGLDILNRETDLKRLPPGFDYSSQAILYLPESMPEPNSREFAGRAAEVMGELLKISRGRAFLLFTSFRNMNEVYKLLADKLPYTVLRQGDAPRSELIEAFREDEHSVLFATASFWQGVDVIGPSLSCVIIDKLPFASPGDPVTEARIEHINASDGNAFMSYQVPAAVISLRQGLGRLIRSRSDHGLLAVLDPRVKTRRYGQVFLRGLPPMPKTGDLEHVRKFFSERERG